MAGEIWRSKCGAVELRLGRWQDVLADVTCDALIFDAPYSSKTHASHSPTTSVLTACTRDAKWAARGGVRGTIDYECMTTDGVHEFVSALAPKCRGWIVSLTDDVLAPTWAESLRVAGRYVFAPLPCVSPGSRVRLTGDGPSSWTVWAVVGRTKHQVKWGTLPGAYIVPPEDQIVIGGKPIKLMRKIVSDYSRPGDLICDPCAGGATTLLAAVIEGRRAIGAEMSEETYLKAVHRLEKGWTPSMFIGRESNRAMEETPLFHDDTPHGTRNKRG